MLNFALKENTQLISINTALYANLCSGGDEGGLSIFSLVHFFLKKTAWLFGSLSSFLTTQPNPAKMEQGVIASHFGCPGFADPL